VKDAKPILQGRLAQLSRQSQVEETHSYEILMVQLIIIQQPGVGLAKTNGIVRCLQQEERQYMYAYAEDQH
jgi:hypothetical protein